MMSGANQPGRPKRFTAQEMADALRAVAGIQAAAARALHCDVSTVKRYVREYPTVKEALEEARDGIVDLAESQLLIKLREGHWPAIKFVLQTIGRDRGWNPDADIRAAVQREVRAFVANDASVGYDEVMAEVEDIFRRNAGLG